MAKTDGTGMLPSFVCAAAVRSRSPTDLEDLAYFLTYELVRLSCSFAGRDRSGF